MDDVPSLSDHMLHSLHTFQSSMSSSLRSLDRTTVIAGTAVTLLTLPVLWKLLKLPSPTLWLAAEAINTDARSSDPAILKKHSTFRSFNVPSTGYTYPGIRVVYRDHPQTEKLPSTPSSLPLLVFVHGLGGSAAQFAPLLTSLINVGPCLCIDLPGCGLSDFAPEDWSAYTQPALAALVSVIINSYRNRQSNQGVVLIAHSMGCSISARVASGLSEPSLAPYMVGIVALCPRATDMSDSDVNAATRLTSIPTALFNILRGIDKIGGIGSSSVRRYVGPDAAPRTRKLQYRYNSQSKTEVFRRMLRGAAVGPRQDILADYSIWERIEAPVFLVGGESDNLTPPSEVRKLAAHLTELKGSLLASPHTHFDGVIGDGGPRRGVRMAVLPAPASHALLFAPEQCRVTSGLIQGFLGDCVDKRLSLGWQLQYLTQEGKWDVKNLEKWQKIEPVSPLIGGTFRAMKTMREIDDVHNPTAFARQWKGKVKAVVDISHEAPVYDPKRLDEGGIEYHKLPTVSKLPPTAEEINPFNELIDNLASGEAQSDEKPVIAVHCHYGFNRTGYFIICYLVDRMGWKLQDAIEEFNEKRSPGIKHQHFIDELYVRYCSGLGGLL